MKIFKLLSTLVLIVLCGNQCFTQDLSNKGKEFYLCFPQHVPSGTNLATLSIFITSDKASTGTITMGNGAFSSTFSITANGIQEIQIPWAANRHISNGESNNVINKSIKIQVDPGKPAVVAYAQQWAGFRSAATLLLPVNVLGKKYYAISFTQNGQNNPPYSARSQFQIIAVKNNTVVTITPRKNGVVGIPFTIFLPLAGDMYQYQSTDAGATGAAVQDLTGTLIESVASGTGGCLPIAVFSGSSNITFGTSAPACTGTSSDPLWQQVYPVTTWGKNFGFVPFEDYPRGTSYRVLASEDNTQVFFNGALVATLNAGQIYPAAFTSSPVVTTAPINISADKPICVAQYSTTEACSGSAPPKGDPDMVILNPIEQNISDIIIFSSDKEGITRQWVNVLMKTLAIPSFRLNGAIPATAWQAFPTLPGYSYLRHLLPGIGAYRLQADSGFNAIAYGWGTVESYAYSAGTNVKDLFTKIETVTPFGSATSPSVCRNLPTQFKITVPYPLDSMYWNFNGTLPNIMVNGPPVPLTPFSTAVVNGQTVYTYVLTTPNTFPTAGTFPVTVTTYSQNTSGCGAEQDIYFDVEVYEKPVADFTFTSNGCTLSPVSFLDNSNLNGRTATSWHWNFGDGNTSTVLNPSNTFATPGSFTVKHTVLNDIGCISDTISKVVTITNQPAASFSAATPYCNGTAVNFTDNSTLAGIGSITDYLWNFGDPASGVNNTSTLPTPSHLFTGPGSYTVSLTATSSSGCQSAPFTLPITVAPIVTPTFTQVAPICSGGILSPLPATSNNGITGTWAPAVNNTTTTTYTFTPAAGQCASATVTMTITVNPNVTPTFNPVSPICSGGVLNPLPTTSLNGFTGTWAPALNNTTTTTYTFTPDAGQCATTAPLTITVNPLLSPAISCGTSTTSSVTFNWLAVTGATGYTVTYQVNANPVTNVGPVGNVLSYQVTGLSGGNTVTINVTPTGGAGTCFSAAIFTCVANACTPPTANISYSGSPFCVSNTTPQSVTLTGTGSFNGGTYSSTAGLTINSSTGAITPSTSTPGTYIVTYTVTPSGCNPVSVTTSVTITAVITPTFNPVAAICSGASLSPLPTTSNNGITGIWSPALNNTNTTTYTFTPTAGQCASTTTLVITVNPNILPTFNPVAPICVGGSLSPLPTTSLNGFTGSWAPALNNNVTTTYTFTPDAGQCATTATMTIVVNPVLTPTINCGVSTTSSVIFNWNAVTGATGYTVSYQVNANPIVNVGPIGNLLTYQVTSLSGGNTVSIVVTPTGGAGTCFSSSSHICSATACTPPTANISYAGPFCGNNSTPQAVTLTGTGNFTGGTYSSTTGLTINSTTGAITPSTSTPGTYTVTYTVPAGGGCLGITATTSVTIDPVVTPVFTPVAAICSGGSLSPLPTTSNNGITGIWAPVVNNSNTTTYTFTPTAGLCASTGTLTITVNPNITPTFSQVNPICSGAVLSPLPTTSNNGITGTWAPAISNTVTTTYTFTPTAGLCATTAVMTITVIPNVTPTFPPVAPICSGATLSPLPMTSTNGISGTWAPSLNNTATTTYTFTPNAGQCGTTTTLTITVNPNITPTFNPVAAICAGGTLAPLPTTSNNGYTGSWAPALNNLNTTTYTFTPSAGQCATTTTLTITVNPNVTPTFNPVAAICSGDVIAPLPTTSLNSITGTWAPAINNTVTTTYTFTPSAGLCAVTTTLTITVNPIVTPAFNPVPEICSGAALAPLPTTSTNGITGTWAPALNNTATTIYTFTPTAGQCAVTATLTITVNPLPASDFSFSNPTCATKAVSFTDLSVANAGTLTNWLWNFGDPGSGLNNISNLQNPAHVFSTGGNYNVTLIVTTSKGCISTITTKPVVVNVLPKAEFTFPQACLTDQVPFTDNSSVSSGSIVGWNWNFGDPASGANNTSTFPNPTHLFSAVGSFTTRLIVTSSNGCMDTITKPVTINGSLLVSNFTVQNSNTLCSDQSVSITDGSTVDFGSIIRVEVFWDYNNDPTIQTIDPRPVPGKIYTHTYPEFGTPLTKTVSIRYVVYSGINCVTTFSRNVTLLATPLLQFDPIPAVCSNVPAFQITEAQILNPLPGIGIFSGPGVSSTGLFSPTIAGTGTHTIQFTYTGANGCIKSITQTIDVDKTPIANAGPDKFIIEGGVVILTPALNTGLLVTYNWSPPTGLSNPNIATPAASPAADITYTLTVTTDKGCSRNDEVFVKVLKALVIPNVFSPNGDGINDKWIIQYLDGFPEGTINVYNRYGQSVYRSIGYSEPWDGTFKGKPVPAGTYYYIIDPKRGSKILAGFVDVLR